MKSFQSLIWAAALLWACAAAPSLAHHSFAAEFDRNLTVEVTGTVTKVEWTNPHARFYVDAEDENGEIANWDFEMTTPNILARQGWRRDSLKPGDVVSVSAFRARNAPHVGNVRSVTLASTGQRLFSQEQAPSN